MKFTFGPILNLFNLIYDSLIFLLGEELKD